MISAWPGFGSDQWACSLSCSSLGGRPAGAPAAGQSLHSPGRVLFCRSTPALFKSAVRVYVRRSTYPGDGASAAFPQTSLHGRVTHLRCSYLLMNNRDATWRGCVTQYKKPPMQTEWTLVRANTSGEDFFIETKDWKKEKTHLTLKVISHFYLITFYLYALY